MFRAPRQLPPLSLLVDDVGGPQAAARYLGVSPRTLARWRAAEHAPRPVMLALFFESRWGISVLHTDAHNAACHSAAVAAGLGREVARLSALLKRMEAAADWGSANAPTYLAAR